MECKREENLVGCTCTCLGCGNRGICCECVRHHRENGELPGCFFPPAAERTYDRSIKNFVLTWKDKLGL